MLFQYESNGNRHQVTIRTQPVGSDWLATAVSLSSASDQPEEFLRSGSSGTAVQLQSPNRQEATERMALILKNVYGCTPID